jgi:hypothetical protein
MMMCNRFKFFVGGLILIGALGLGGCLQDEASMFVRYDEGADRFAMLTVYEHFRSSGSVGNKENLATDTKELVRLWEARDRLIPIEPSIFGTPNCLELSADHRSLVDAEKDVEAAGIAWETIEIIPGKMFKDADGALGLYQEVRVPGKVVDAWLGLAAARLAKNEGLVKALAEERARRQGGGGRKAWAAVRTQAREAVERSLARLDLENAPHVEGDEAIIADLWACLEDRSLEAVRDWMNGQKITFARRGRTVNVVIPLTAADAKEVAGLVVDLGKTWDTFSAADAQKAGPEATIARRVRPAIKEAIDFKALENGLQISVDMVGLENGLVSSMRAGREMQYRGNAEMREAAKAMADAAGPKVTVSEGVDVAKVIEEFKRTPAKP